MFALSRVLSPDVTSLLSILIGPHIQTFILYADWLKITITDLRRGCHLLRNPYCIQNASIHPDNAIAIVDTLCTPCDNSYSANEIIRLRIGTETLQNLQNIYFLHTLQLTTYYNVLFFNGGNCWGLFRLFFLLTTTFNLFLQDMLITNCCRIFIIEFILALVISGFSLLIN